MPVCLSVRTHRLTRRNVGRAAYSRCLPHVQPARLHRNFLPGARRSAQFRHLAPLTREDRQRCGPHRWYQDSVLRFMDKKTVATGEQLVVACNSTKEQIVFAQLTATDVIEG